MGGEGGRAELEDGTRLFAETCRRLSCDASVVRVTHDRDGSVLDVGRKMRTIPGALRRALEVRDGGDGAADALVQRNLVRGIEPDFGTCAALYRREEDIPWPVIVRAVDALETGNASDAGTC